ncbi:uncharacterized protein LOC126888689 [Diabrotica virgifera virgifera]|uniref:Reverse transcriptase domain-containing protein n=1 Tax=Diabrotica virgifera virgifera TaxID=50390 RepID=A0ABM5KS53_DIAVI|nr:uncharacterized protein LOC126888689 [Diabrotica virgifera virgifera]
MEHKFMANADNLTVVAEKREDIIIKAINNLDVEAKKVGLVINEIKTDYMKLNEDDRRGLIITGKYKFEEVTKYGKWMKWKEASGVLYDRSNRQVSTKLKEKLYKATIITAIMYRSGCWVATKKRNN